MRFFIIISFSFFILLSCSVFSTPPKEIIKTQKYPKWFIQPSQKIIGLAPRYYYIEKSIKAAKKAALRSFTKLRYSIVKGFQTYIQTPEGFSIADDSLYIHIFEDQIFSDKFYKNYTPVDTFYTNKFVAICFSKQSKLPTKEKQLVKFKKKCKFIKSIPEDNHYFYAIGICDKVHNENTSWDISIDNGILNLARQICLYKYSETLLLNQTMMGKHTETINLELNNIEIVKRWKDFKQNIYYTLVKTKR